MNYDIEIKNQNSIYQLEFGGVPSTAKQIYKGPTEPVDSNILIWIDTSGTEPISTSQLITADNLRFITADNKDFILKEV